MATKRVSKVAAWLAAEGAKFQQVTPNQTNYVGGVVPFPLNPTFRPNAPLSNLARTNLYKEWRKNPEHMTPRKLSTMFNISIKRVEAIIRLKAYEERMSAKGIVSQTKYAEGMEKMLCAQNKLVLPERSVEITQKMDKPRYVTTGEAETLSAKATADMLKRNPYPEIRKKLSLVGHQALTPLQLKLEEESKSQPKTVHSVDKALGNKRWKFMITDVNRKLELQDRQVLVREQDGTLRAATKHEHLRRARDMSWL